MKALAKAAVVCGACLFIALSSAAAGTGHRVRATLLGTSDWSSQFVAETFTMQGSVVRASGLAGSAGRGTYSGTLHAGPYGPPTGDCGPVCAPVTGTIVFATRHGELTTSVEPGSTVSEADTASLTEYDFTLALKIVDGTRGYSGTEGDLSLDYAAVRFNPPECSPCTSEDSGTLTGTITRRSATAAPLASPFLAR